LVHAGDEDLDADQLTLVIEQRSAHAAKRDGCVHQIAVIPGSIELRYPGLEPAVAGGDSKVEKRKSLYHRRRQPSVNPDRVHDASEFDPLTVFIAGKKRLHRNPAGEWELSPTQDPNLRSIDDRRELAGTRDATDLYEIARLSFDGRVQGNEVNPCGGVLDESNAWLIEGDDALETDRISPASFRRGKTAHRRDLSENREILLGERLTSIAIPIRPQHRDGNQQCVRGTPQEQRQPDIPRLPDSHVALSGLFS
jgi:hypothetical protein